MADPVELSCHCRAIRLRVDEAVDGLVQCNCSTCRRFGAIHWYVKTTNVTLVDESKALGHYVWRFVHEGHHFCPTCGASIMRTGYPNGVVALNACLIDDVDIFELPTERFDGRNEIPPGALP